MKITELIKELSIVLADQGNIDVMVSDDECPRAANPYTYGADYDIRGDAHQKALVL